MRSGQEIAGVWALFRSQPESFGSRWFDVICLKWCPGGSRHTLPTKPDIKIEIYKEDNIGALYMSYINNSFNFFFFLDRDTYEKEYVNILKYMNFRNIFNFILAFLGACIQISSVIRSATIYVCLALL